MPRPTATEALELLKAGNARFVAGAPIAEPYGPRVAELAGGQQPFAVVLGCSDSRVPIETVFDQVPGKLFVVRVAGNFVNPHNLGSIEFAVAALQVQLVVVLGHGDCGAVGAALRYVRDGLAQRGHIQDVVDAVAPAVRAAADRAGDWHHNAVAENVALNVRAIASGSRIIAESASSGGVQVIGGIYNVTTGRVAFS
jgi:carbonic anhydrase